MKLKFFLLFLFTNGQSYSVNSFQILINEKWEDPNQIKNTLEILKSEGNKINFSDLLKILEFMTKQAKNIQEVKNFFKEYFFKGSDLYKKIFEAPRDPSIVFSDKKKVFELGLEWLYELQDTSHLTSTFWSMLLLEIFKNREENEKFKNREENEKISSFSQSDENVFLKLKEENHNKFAVSMGAFFSSGGILDPGMMEKLGFKERLNALDDSNFGFLIGELCSSNQKISLNFFEDLVEKINTLHRYDFIHVISSIMKCKQTISLHGFEVLIPKINMLNEECFLRFMLDFCNSNQKISSEFFKKLNFNRDNFSNAADFFGNIICYLCNSKQEIPSEIFENLVKKINELDDFNFFYAIEELCNSKQTISSKVFEHIDFEKVNSLNDFLFCNSLYCLFRSNQKIPKIIFEKLDFERLNDIEDSKFVELISYLCHSKNERLISVFELINFQRMNALNDFEFSHVVSELCNSEQKIPLNIFQNILDVLDYSTLSYSKRLIIASYFCKMKDSLNSEILKEFYKFFFETPDYEKINRLSDSSFNIFVIGFCNYYDKKEILDKFSQLSIRLKPAILKNLIISKKILDDIDTSLLPLLKDSKNFSLQEKTKELILSVISCVEIEGFANTIFEVINAQKGLDYSKKFANLVTNYIENKKEEEDSEFNKNLKIQIFQDNPESINTLNKKNAFYDWCALRYKHEELLQEHRHFFIRLMKILCLEAENQDFCHQNKIQSAMNYLDVVYEKKTTTLAKDYENLILQTIKNNSIKKLKVYLMQRLPFYFERKTDINRSCAKFIDIKQDSKVRNSVDEEKKIKKLNKKNGVLRLRDFCKALDWGVCGYDLFRGYGYTQSSVSEFFEKHTVPYPGQFDPNQVNGETLNQGYEQLATDLFNIVFKDNESTIKYSNYLINDKTSFFQNLKNDLEQFFKNAYPSTDQIFTLDHTKDATYYHPGKFCLRLQEIINDGKGMTLDKHNFPDARCPHGTLLNLRLAYAEMHGNTMIGFDFEKCPKLQD
ncbi:hypothetical protein P618_200672 [Holospora obtusa F1]|uniref:Uncharacterized protein n=1 Tax=Holospora obtusa F1 TaxID=1399147 RepID=W6TEG4_HOLOB|nr:hypothetical protein [Holospora obtusa]ETZ07129.1 hypothetical protein P618_200672 [Holospora obtusa F1]